MCQVPCVRCQASCVSCEMSEKATAGDTDLEQEPVFPPNWEICGQNRPKSNVAMAYGFFLEIGYGFYRDVGRFLLGNYLVQHL